MIFHKHLLINAKVTNPITSEEDAITFLRDLVERINMKILKGPFASYVDKEGNRVYLKAVKNGVSDHSLSKEEKEALEKAINTKN
jgi:hypothetical protein